MASKGGARDVDALLRRRLALLERIDVLGSITAAARAVGLSYKAAWEAVEALNSASDAALVERVAGGAGGGGTRLTAGGAKLVKAFRAVDKERLSFLRGLGGRAGELAPLLGWLRRLSMRTSARNQFFGIVAGLKRGEISSEVTLALPGGDRLSAVITNASVDELRLARGATAFALVKASWVILAPGGPAFPARARNIFAGLVERLSPGKENVEVLVRMPGGAPLVAVLTEAAAKNLSLRPGRKVRASVDARNVILGVNA